MFKDYLIVTETIFKNYLIVTLKKVEVLKNLPHTLEVLLSAAPKVLKYCLMVEGNPDS